MIFPTESLYQLRRALVAKVAAGEITEVEGFRKALEADPDDSTAVAFLARYAEEAGDLPEAERYARQLIRNHPSGHQGYLLLARILGGTDRQSILMRGYAELGLAKMQFNEESLQDLDVDRFAQLCGASEATRSLPEDQVLAVLAEALKKQRSLEPIEVEEEMRAHRLVHELREFRDDVLDRTVVDGILEHGAACQPLLLGILKEFGAELLTDDDYRMVERAIALLGEMGNPAVLPVITEFLTLNEDDLAGPADWAFRRISFRHPAETLARIAEMLPAAGAPERVVLGQQIALTPNVPGRIEVLSNVTKGIEGFPKAEREAVVFSAIAGFYLVEGGKSFQAALLERKYANSFSEDGRSDLRKLHKETASLEPGDASPDELSIYEICCEEPALATDEDGDDDREPVVKRDPKPGRNEPCWCGSGKKYKKCHLDQDQRG
jgi:tetratricopeptide (TPR) repeat protein